MEKVSDLIDALKSGDNIAASNVFGDLMNDKINDSLDDRRIGIAQSMFGAEPDVEVEEDPVGDYIEDEDIQGISDDEIE